MAAPSAVWRGLAVCDTKGMKKRLPDAVLPLKPVEKLVWLYIDRYPGEHSVRSIDDALGVYSGRALPSLVELGLLVEEEPATRSKGGKYRTTIPAKEKAE